MATAPPPGSPPDRQLRRRFWTLVGAFNLALLALAVGVLLVLFERRFVVGGGLVVLGAGVFALGWRGYRRARRND